MHSFQAQYSLTDTTTGVNINSGVSRESVADTFNLNSFVVPTGTPLTLSYLPITTPYRVTVKFISGDPINVSLNGGTTFPLALKSSRDFLVLQLNPTDVPTFVFSVPSGGPTGTTNIAVTVEPT